MKPSLPFHINYPSATDRDYEVIGHRDGPIVARFPFDLGEPEYKEAAKRWAEMFVEVTDPTTSLGKMVYERERMLGLLRRIQLEGWSMELGHEVDELLREVL
jgi:hypothetical protein